ncbi:MAG: Glycosyl transferase, group 1 family [Parcubacteria group bacterium GW2011_GWD2_38_11]|nr:MAG: Glycosyl transferase, group 1 family [Parcubacteria group bacterium GW2011_GWD2_38_11]
MKQTNIIFISRAYPPVIGGIENQNYELSLWLAKVANIKTIANTKGKKFLPFFLPIALFQAIFLLPKYDVVLLGDGVLGIIGWIIKLISKKPVICVVHGLDLTFISKIYQTLWVNFFIQKIDKLIAVGNETVSVAIKKGISKEKIVFIPNGVDTEKHLIQASQADLEKIIGKSIANKKVLMTSGRLAKRKGVAWFVTNVMPKLDESFIYVVAGAGPDKENISQAIKNNNLENRVTMLGYIPDQDRNILWATSDLFVQPNIKIAGDMEGFGISVIEAGASRLPVLASNIEGLKDAIKDERNGYLVESENADAYVEKINKLFENGNPRETYGQAVRDFVIENYQWKNIARIYLSEIEKVINKKL